MGVTCLVIFLKMGGSNCRLLGSRCLGGCSAAMVLPLLGLFSVGPTG